MFGGGTQNYRGQSTEASSIQHGLLTSTQPAIGKDFSQQQRTEANESTFFYNSDEDREVEEILQQSNRLMERRNDNSFSLQNSGDEERLLDLQRQKLELLSLQHPNQESTLQANDSHLIDQSAVNIGEMSRINPQTSS